MSEKNSMQQWFVDLETNDLDDLKFDFAVLVERALDAQKISRKDLATLINVSPARITTILRGDANLTLQVMHKIAKALDQKLHLHFAPKGTKVHVFNAISSQDEIYESRSESFNSQVFKLSRYKPFAIAA